MHKGSLKNYLKRNWIEHVSKHSKISTVHFSSVWLSGTLLHMLPLLTALMLIFGHSNQNLIIQWHRSDFFDPLRLDHLWIRVTSCLIEKEIVELISAWPKEGVLKLNMNTIFILQLQSKMSSGSQLWCHIGLDQL